MHLQLNPYSIDILELPPLLVEKCASRTGKAGVDAYAQRMCR